MNNILNQLSKLIDNEHITIGALERKIGASKGVLSRAIQNNTDIQAKWIQTIVENYPTYNIEWLITGNGRMLKEHNNIAADHPPEYHSDTYKDKYIRILEAENERLLAENERKQEIIDSFMNGDIVVSKKDIG